MFEQRFLTLAPRVYYQLFKTEFIHVPGEFSHWLISRNSDRLILVQAIRMAKECKQDALRIARDVRLLRVHAPRYFLDSCSSKEKMDAFGKRVLLNRKCSLVDFDDKFDFLLVTDSIVTYQSATNI